MKPTETVAGVVVWRGLLDRAAQEQMLAEVEEVCRQAPLVRPLTPWGKPMRVAMTSAGRFGWITDRRGYRYERFQPDGRSWPAIPPSVLDLWAAITGATRPPDCCLVNRYGEGARMGLHQDRDEADFGWPVVSVSLGDDALFRIGGTERRDPTRSFWLCSGDVLSLGGPARLAFHGIDRTRFRSSDLLPGGGRINLTLRIVE